MTRKTYTVEYKKEVVHFCVDNLLDYRLTMEKYEIDKPRLKRWVDAYLVEGDRGLYDKRHKEGLPPAECKLQEVNERLRIRIAELQKENERLKIGR